MSRHSGWRLISVAMLLLGSCWPAYGQTPPEAKPSSRPADAQTANEQPEIRQLIANVIDTAKSKPMSEDDLRKAIERLTEELRKDRDKVELIVARAGAHVQLGEMKEAESDLSKALKIAPNHPTAWYVHAQSKIDADEAQANAGSVKEGIAALKKANALGYSNSELFVVLGNAHHKLGDNRRALSAFGRAIEGNVKEAYCYRGDLYSHMGEPRLAMADYSKAIDLGVAVPTLFLGRARIYYEDKKYREGASDCTRAILADPNFAEAYHGRALCNIGLKDWSAALKDLDSAVQLKPNCNFIAERGCAYIQHQEYAKGIVDLRRAIQLNSGDVGATYKANSYKKVTSEALAYGEQQLRRMLKDRPAMESHIAPGDKLWVWAVRKFAGEDLGVPIDWDPGIPPVNTALHEATDGKTNGRVQVSPFETPSTDKAANFEEMWCRLVFELNNINTSPEAVALVQQAFEGKIASDEYVERTLKREELAVQRTRAFYITCFLEWVPKSALEKTDPFKWYCNSFTHGSGAVFLREDDPRPRAYATHFNGIRASAEYQQGNFAKAKEYLNIVLANEDYLTAEQIRDARLIACDVNISGGDFEGAIKDATVVLKLSPDDERALYLRGYALVELSKYDEALNDFNRVLRSKPDNVDVLEVRSAELSRRGDDKAALADLNKAISLQPKNSVLHSRRAILLLGSRDAAIRNMSAGLNDARRSCELTEWKSAYELGLLASAYAELSDFGNAVKWQEKAVAASPAPEKEGYATRLDLYKQLQQRK